MEGALKHLQMGSSLEKPYLLGALMVLPAEPGAGDSGHLFLHFLEYESWTMGVLAWRADGPTPHGWLLPLFAHDRWGRRFEELRKYTVFCSVTVDVLVIDAQETGVTVRFWPTDQASCKPTLLLPAQFVRGNLKLRLYDQKSQFSNTVKPTWITEDEAGMTYEEIGDLSRLAR